MSNEPDHTAEQPQGSGPSGHHAAEQQTLLDMLLAEEDSVDWFAVLDRVRSHPSEASERSVGTLARSPLVLAIDASDPSNPAPCEVVQALVDANPAAARETDDAGVSPLFWAAAAEGLGEDSMKAVLRAFPIAATRPSAGEELLPLHVASGSAKARVLIEAWPRGLGSGDNAGRLPLHFAARYGSPGLFRALVEEASRRLEGGVAWTDRNGGLTTPSCDGLTPLDAICSLVKVRTKLADGNSEASAIYTLLDEAGTRLMDKFAICAETMIPPCRKSNNVHAAILLSCPPEVVWHTIAADPARLKQRDAMGRIPLHIAVEMPDTPEAVLRILLHPCWGHRSTAAAEDGEGRLPLALLALNRKMFDGSFGSLVAAEPRALRVQDKKTGLYPFMLAALGADSVLDTIFGLLLEDPSLVAMFVCRE